MYESQFTLQPLPEPDPLAIEVFIGLNARRPTYVDPDLENEVGAEIASCGDLPSPRVIGLFAAVGIHIREQSPAKTADKDVAYEFCRLAIQNDKRKWLVGRWLHAIEVDFADWADQDFGYRGCLAPEIRRVFYAAAEFAPYYFKRQGVSSLNAQPAGKARKKQSMIIVNSIWLMNELENINAKRRKAGSEELRLKPTPLAEKSPSGALQKGTWRKLLNNIPVRSDVVEKLPLFFKLYGRQLITSEIPQTPVR
jgi:hypothetical protein